MLFSVIAIYKESWFRPAFISVEVAYSVNITIMWIFWGIIWPTLTKGGDAAITNAKTPEEKKKLVDFISHIKLYYTIIHIVPFIATVINLAITDMALNKSHWWIAVITLCPCYMLLNMWASLTIGTLNAKGEKVLGSIYSVEQWIKAPVTTTVIFVILAFVQGFSFWLSCLLVEKLKPVVDWIEGDDGKIIDEKYD